MLECLILGDSLGVGLHRVRPQCALYAHVGINSKQYNRRWGGEFFSDVVIISLGSNDHRGINTTAELKRLRDRVVAKTRVVWIMPAGNVERERYQTIRSAVYSIAEQHGDMVVDAHPQYMAKDGIHPTRTGYVWLDSFISAQTGLEQRVK